MHIYISQYGIHIHPSIKNWMFLINFLLNSFSLSKNLLKRHYFFPYRSHVGNLTSSVHFLHLGAWQLAVQMPNIDRLQQTEKKKGESIHCLVCNMEKLCDSYPCIHCLLSPTPYTCMILKVCKLITVKLSLYFCFLISSGMLSLSGNSNLEDAINWIAEHEDDPDIDQMPLVQYFLSPIFCGYGHCYASHFYFFHTSTCNKPPQQHYHCFGLQ